MFKINKRRADLVAFEALFEANWKQMYMKAFAFLRDEDESCEVIKSVFVDLLRNKSFRAKRNWERHLAELLKAQILAHMLQRPRTHNSIDAAAKSKMEDFGVEELLFPVNIGQNLAE